MWQLSDGDVPRARALCANPTELLAALQRELLPEGDIGDMTAPVYPDCTVDLAWVLMDVGGATAGSATKLQSPELTFANSDPEAGELP